MNRAPFPERSVYAGWRASHFAELWYAFDHLNQEPWAWTASDRALAQTMATYWTNFAKTGDPNGPGMPRWPRFDNHGDDTLYLGSPKRTGDLADAIGLRIFDAVHAQVRGAPVP